MYQFSFKNRNRMLPKPSNLITTSPLITILSLFYFDEIKEEQRQKIEKTERNIKEALSSYYCFP
jgi:hypothetical protein